MELEKQIQALFVAARAEREATQRILAEPDHSRLALALSQQTDEALGLADEDERALRIERLASLCAEVPSEASVAALLRALDHEEAGIRVSAGEALLAIAYERFVLLGRAIEGLVKNQHEGLSMEELPHLLAHVYEPDVLPLILGFTRHPRAEVVAAAIEAMLELGDERAVDRLRELSSDTRRVELDELEDSEATLAELAREAIEELSASPEQDAKRGTQPR